MNDKEIIYIRNFIHLNILKLTNLIISENFTLCYNKNSCIFLLSTLTQLKL